MAECFSHLSEVSLWLASISQGLHLERFAFAFESTGFRSKESLKYLHSEDVFAILGSCAPQILLAEKRIIETELAELRKAYRPTSHPLLEQQQTNTSLQAVNVNHLASVQSINNINVGGEILDIPPSYMERKTRELSESLNVAQVKLASAKQKLVSDTKDCEQFSIAENGRRGKICGRCHLSGHYKSKCSSTPCTDMKLCGASEKHPEIKESITELKKLVKELEKKELKSSSELESFKAAKERSVNNFFAIMRPRLRKQDEIKYLNRSVLDKELICLKKVLNNKIPMDESKDREFPHLIQRYKNGHGLDENQFR